MGPIGIELRAKVFSTQLDPEVPHMLFLLLDISGGGSDNMDPICYPLPVCISFNGADEGTLYNSGFYAPVPRRFCKTFV